MHISIFAVSIEKQDGCTGARLGAFIEAISTSPKEQQS
jgi:hypothetical protein